MLVMKVDNYIWVILNDNEILPGGRYPERLSKNTRQQLWEEYEEYEE